MRSVRFPALIALAAAACLGGGAMAARPALSWGKSGVSFEAYRADATACLRAAAAIDLTGTEPAEALVLGTRRIAMAQNFDPMTVGEAAAAARPELRLHQARDIMQARLDHCLVEHGYHRFRLTDSQRHQLGRYGLDRPERQVYLHSLASDPQILASQAVNETATR